MTGLLDGRHVPWHFVYGETEPEPPQLLPPAVRRDTAPPLPTAQDIERLNQALTAFFEAVKTSMLPTMQAVSKTLAAAAKARGW